MLDNQGNSKGYFTKDDFIYALLMLPNQHWTIDQAEQTLHALAEEGKLQEIEPGNTNPVHCKNNEDYNKKRYLLGRAINDRDM